MAEAFPKCIVCGAPQRLMFLYRDYHYYRCPACHQVSTYPLPDQKTIEDHYHQKFLAGNYRLLRRYAEQYKNVYRQFVDILKTRFAAQSKSLAGMTALDVGCFTGDFSALLVDEGVDAYGLELQTEAVALAAQRIPGRVFQADVMGDCFPKKDYDFITLLGVIEHVTDPRKLIRRSAQLLKRGGMVMLQTPNSGSLLARGMKHLWPPYAPVEHIHLFSAQSIHKLLADEGFVNVTIKAHVKSLPISYVFNQLQNFGPEFYRLARPFRSIIERLPKRFALPFYGGEMIVVARKSPALSQFHPARAA
jgi:2-polyprenyl-3-methyl-5-hydroxy-6-metoxy-1,4-benzoquinol methylase